ncbi:3052_t:CDS:10 [Ambispora gerdemannii]|uniref:Proliferation-associated SNF2-like protein n=1 Tax=Ambispora gerdemannii TaxID=144530 RepID=A0A9N9G6M4_9GLOM|nr:3052_t:CDS:10 [Ambispora gerdemannii]
MSTTTSDPTNSYTPPVLPALVKYPSSIESVNSSSVATPSSNDEPFFYDLIEEPIEIDDGKGETSVSAAGTVACLSGKNKENLKTLKEEAFASYDEIVNQGRVQRLNFLIEKSSLYANFLAQKMEAQKQALLEQATEQERKRVAKELKNQKAAASAVKNSGVNGPSCRTRSGGAGGSKQQDEASSSKTTKTGTKRKTNPSTEANYYLGDYVNSEDLAKRRKHDDSDTTSDEGESITRNIKPTPSIRQPRLVTGGILRDYQLAGFEWLVSLYDNGLNGILGDEMGLGKTLQTIAFFAFLWERKIYGPFLVVAPVSTLANWVSEFNRFTPTLPVALYHGSPECRAHLRNTRMIKGNVDKVDAKFPIVVTSYEIAMRDRKYLQKLNWKYLVIDEGHRIKNYNCKLLKELRLYSSANRLLLTGTPLQNNLGELWSLLNFLLPDIFDDWDTFQKWFDFSALNEKNGEKKILEKEEENLLITNLHKILKPFLLRRVKSDVEHSLPKKREYLVYAPFTRAQKELYDAIVNKNIRSFLIKKHANLPQENDAAGDDTDDHDVTVDTAQNDDVDNEVYSVTLNRKARKVDRVNYKEDIDDDEYFELLEKKAFEAEEKAKASQDSNNPEYVKLLATKKVNAMKLQNTIMQLRKVCNHPYLFNWPINATTKEPIVSDDLVHTSGKIMLLDQLLTVLLERQHKVLVFSQFTTMLDIIEDWITIIKGWDICRLDGAVSQEERRRQIQEFNTKPEKKVFILSTRAGGLGINLTAADTVIIFDSDWNPQMDLQAQDRVHRIGQSKPVIIYRLVTANTVESKILEKASAKRKLEKLVIHKGKFKSPSQVHEATASLAELAEILNANDNEVIQCVEKGDLVIPDDELERILDRSDKAFEKAENEVDSQEGATFKVIRDKKDCEDTLTQMCN